MEQVDNAEEWSIDHYTRDMSEHILNYVFNTGKFPNIRFASGPVGPETQPQLVNNTMVIKVPQEMDHAQFAVALATNYQNGVNLEIEYGNSNSQCKISILKPNVTSHDGVLNEVKILNQQNKDQPTYYRLVQKDNNYLIMACTATSLEEKKIIQNQYEAGNNYNRGFENRTLSDSEPQNAKKTYLRALRHFAITGEMPEGAADQAPDENDTDERALHAACAILKGYNNDNRKTLFQNSLIALLSNSDLEQDETLTGFAKCLVHVVSKIYDKNQEGVAYNQLIQSITYELNKEENSIFNLELLANAFNQKDSYTHRFNAKFESEDIYNLYDEIDKLTKYNTEGNICIGAVSEEPQTFNENDALDITYTRVKVYENAFKEINNKQHIAKLTTRLISNEGNYLLFTVNNILFKMQKPKDYDNNIFGRFTVPCVLPETLDSKMKCSSIEVYNDKLPHPNTIIITSPTQEINDLNIPQPQELENNNQNVLASQQPINDQNDNNIQSIINQQNTSSTVNTPSIEMNKGIYNPVDVNKLEQQINVTTINQNLQSVTTNPNDYYQNNITTCNINNVNDNLMGTSNIGSKNEEEPILV